MSINRVKILFKSTNSYIIKLLNDTEEAASKMVATILAAKESGQKLFKLNNAQDELHTWFEVDQVELVYSFTADMEKEEADKAREKANAETYSNLLKAQLKSYKDVKRGEAWRGDDEENENNGDED